MNIDKVLNLIRLLGKYLAICTVIAAVLHGIIFLGAVSVIHRKLDRHTHLGGGSGRIVAQAACVFAVFQKDGK
ncbi:MAG: hypothetical protein V1792_08245, partial [Pseudomonadota bacterium]